MDSKFANRDLKLFLAGVGVTAGGAMLALGLIIGGGSAAAEEPPPDPPSLTTGETITETPPPTSPETEVATPSVSATTPTGFAEPH